MSDFDDFDFVEHYGEVEEVADADQLPDNTMECALNCAFVGVGGGGGKLAKAFLDLGFNKTLLINTTEKDQPDDVDEQHLVLIPDADGVAKNVLYGKEILKQNSAVVEDALRTKLGKVDWLFVLCGGGGGTGSSSFALDEAFNRYLKSVEAEGKVFYIATWPSAQELLNSTIAKNAMSLATDLKDAPHIILDNEKQMKILRGKVGILDLFPTANKAFAKLLSQTFKLASLKSSIQSFDSKDLERCMKENKRMLIGTTVIKNAQTPNLGAQILQNCIKRSPCPTTHTDSNIGALLLVINQEMASDPKISQHLDAAISYVGGRTKTLFSGVYVVDNAPGLVAIMLMGGLTE